MEYRKGSVLGLFMIYINNIVDCVAGNTKIYHTLYSDHEDVGLSALQSDLWSKEWQMLFNADNPDKCKVSYACGI